MEGPASQDIGAALRAARRKQRLSLADVAARSDNEFRASSLGAYERGDRAISVPRLQRLARLYGVSPEELLQPRTREADSPDQRANEEVIDLPRLERQESAGLVIDLSRFRVASDARSVAVMNFASAIKAMRKEATSSVIVVRKGDSAVLASLLECDPVDLEQSLTRRHALAAIR